MDPEPFEHHIREEFIKDVNPDAAMPPLPLTPPPAESVATLTKNEPITPQIKMEEVTVEGITNDDEDEDTPPPDKKLFMMTVKKTRITKMTTLMK